ncbi:BTB domain-containing protein [Mycena kentingensis (nom. inval.)]|nr:BTB domain-containing protein [Mycena kentingensis (nom. inval.)]
MNTTTPSLLEDAHDGGTVTQHSEFYAEGDPLCTIRVENTLFKVHRYLLTQASRVFRDLFELPQGDPSTTEGRSDDNPIILCDSAADFASLLKYLYASGCNVTPADIPFSELQNVFAVAELAHKYQMDGWQKWAVNVLLELVHSNEAALSSADLARCYDVAILIGAPTLQSKVATVWLGRITNGSLPILPALAAAEARSSMSRRFLSSLYELELNRIPTSLATPLSYPGYAEVHVKRIFVGQWSLRAWWTHFTATPITLSAGTHCSHTGRHDLCLREFKNTWKGAPIFAYPHAFSGYPQIAAPGLVLPPGYPYYYTHPQALLQPPFVPPSFIQPPPPLVQPAPPAAP